MSLKSAMCPGCGAQIRFESMASLVVVCESCRFASYRRDLDLEKIGKVGEIAPIDSPIELRMRGVLGGRRFSVKGLVQLDHGRGPWNEWSIEFDDGTRAWLAEAQGQYLVTREQRSGELPTYEQLKAGERIDLGAAGEWVIAERGTGRVVALAGELAADIRPGQTVRYADLGGPDDGFGTLDFGEGSVVRTVYLGRRHGLAELGLEGGGKQDRAVRIQAMRVSCPKCAGAIELFDASQAKHVGCPYCGALLAREHQIWKVLEVGELMKSARGPSIGMRGSLDGQQYLVLARLERSIRAEGQRWPWDEWLLRREDGEYRWLVCSDGHWSFVEPVSAFHVKPRGSNLQYKGELFRHFSGGTARVDRVVGELYWEVRLGDEVECADHIAPPRMLSVERTSEETTLSLARYRQPEEVQRMFGLEKMPRKATSRGMIEPTPVRGQLSRFWKTALLMSGLILLSLVLAGAMRRSGEVLRAELPLEAEGAFVSDEFGLSGWRSKVSIGISAPGMEKGHFRAEGQLVEQVSGTVHPFAIQTQGTPLIEGAEELGGSAVKLGSLPAGRYRMKLALHSSLSAPQGRVFIVVNRESNNPGFAFAMILILLAIPVLLSIFGAVFEGQRWQMSDHAS